MSPPEAAACPALIVIGLLLAAVLTAEGAWTDYIGLAITILFLLTLSKALRRCAPENRTMEPGMVWLYLIPIFNLYWQFVTVNRVSESLKNEFYARGIDRRALDMQVEEHILMIEVI